MKKTKSKASILIVDDERNTREGLMRALQRKYTVHLAEGGDQALSILSEEAIDVVLSDVRMPGMDGLSLMKRILARDPQPVCILLTAYGTVDLAVNAMKNGAQHFMTKPVNLEELDIVLERVLENRNLAQENKKLHLQLDQKFGLENIIGTSAAMQTVFETIQQVAPSRATVLIEGESGTGKELVAKALHQLSPRQYGPMISVHCAALSDTLLESELFGHERGAFTGASEQRSGRFEMADGGTLFLDEIGEISMSTQVKILRVLEERQFERVGGRDTIDIDVRLIAATNRNLKSMVDEGSFREDLYYRLNVVRLELPPLRQRHGDVALLLAHYADEFSEENRKPIEGFTPDALDVLTRYEWPGNARELRNVVERMVVMSRNDRLTVRDLPTELRDQQNSGSGGLPPRSTDLTLESAEKDLIIKALETNNGNRTKTAEQLGISRRTLHRKLNEYELRDI